MVTRINITIQVEIHPDYWWKGKFIAAGMIFSPELSQTIRKIPAIEKDYLAEIWNTTITNKKVEELGQHIRHGIMVFINPLVSSLSEKDYLFAGDGCFSGQDTVLNGGSPCDGADQLPDKYNSLLRCYKDAKKMKALGKKVADMYWACEPPKKI